MTAVVMLGITALVFAGGVLAGIFVSREAIAAAMKPPKPSPTPAVPVRPTTLPDSFEDPSCGGPRCASYQCRLAQLDIHLWRALNAGRQWAEVRA